MGEGPYQETDYPIIKNTVPSWGVRERSDATYFRCPGSSPPAVTACSPATPKPAAPARNREQGRMVLRGRCPPDDPALLCRTPTGGCWRRMTRTSDASLSRGHPWIFGPWFQTGHQNTSPNELDYIETLRDADAPVSAVETHMRYMPCGSGPRPGSGREGPRRRTRCRWPGCDHLYPRGDLRLLLRAVRSGGRRRLHPPPGRHPLHLQRSSAAG